MVITNSRRASPFRPCCTPSPPTKSLGFRRFDSSRLLILKGGNSHVRRIYRGSPGKFDSRTLSRKTLSRWTGRKSPSHGLTRKWVARILEWTAQGPGPNFCPAAKVSQASASHWATSANLLDEMSSEDSLSSPVQNPDQQWCTPASILNGCSYPMSCYTK